MSLVTRYHGFTLQPTFVEHGPSSPVSLALDDARLTLWVGEPANVWQTPLSEIHHLEVVVGRRLVIRFTVAGVRYQLRARRRFEHDALIDLMRTNGARVVRATRARAAASASVAMVVLIASGASIIALISSSTVPTRSELAAQNVQRTDLPAGFDATSTSVLGALTGPANQVTTDTTPPPLTGRNLHIWNAVTSNFESCMHESKATDRMFGSAGVIPQLMVSGTTYQSRAHGGVEIGSYAQYYRTTSMVASDVAQYSSPRFGRCWARASAQIVLGFYQGTVAAANTVVTTTNYTPFTLAHGWRRGGVASLTVPGTTRAVSLISVLTAQGHEEVAYFALVSNVASAHAILNAALAAVLARLEPSTTSGSA